MKWKGERSQELTILQHEWYDICQPHRKTKWSGFYIKKKIGSEMWYMDFFSNFHDFHLKFLIISLSEDADQIFLKKDSAERNIFTNKYEWFLKFSLNIYIYIYNHPLVVPPARICLTLSRHPSLSFIYLSCSSGLHPVSSQSCSM